MLRQREQLVIRSDTLLPAPPPSPPKKLASHLLAAWKLEIKSEPGVTGVSAHTNGSTYWSDWEVLAWTCLAPAVYIRHIAEVRIFLNRLEAASSQPWLGL